MFCHQKSPIGLCCVLVLYLTTRSQGQYCNSKSKGCQFECHCVNRRSCNKSTGSCDQHGCEPGWMGEGCQYGNLAYNPESSIIVDGKISTCSNSNNQWILQLNNSYLVSSLRIHVSPHQDSGKRINYITVSDTNNQNKFDENTCVEDELIGTYYTDVRCTHTIKGQYIRIFVNTFIIICEVEIYGGRNIALWKRSQQMGTYSENRFSYSADLAVDGRVSNTLSSRTCSHTKDTTYWFRPRNHDKPWWSVDLEHTYLIQRIVIYFRNDGTLHRARGYYINIIDGSSTEIKIYQGPTDVHEVEDVIPDKFKLAQKLKIIVPGSGYQWDNNMQLCEVQVFACQPWDNTDGCTNLDPIHCINEHHDLSEFKCKNNQCKVGWTGEYCKEVFCHGIQKEKFGNNVKLTNGTYNQRYKFGTQLGFSCEAGFKIDTRNMIATCQQSGQWSSFPTCQAIVCDFASIPPLGEHVTLGIPKLPTYHYYQLLELKCVTGYKAEHKFIRCTDGNTWIGDQPHCRAIVCDPASIPSLGNHVTLVSPHLSTYHYNEYLELKCVTGYKAEHKFIRCTDDNTWIGHQPNCRAIVCDSNSIPSLGEHVTLGSPLLPTYSFNKSLELKCITGFKAEHKFIRCTDDNTWTGDKPNCTAISCQFYSIPDLYDHVTIISPNASTYNYNDHIELHCDSGFKGQPKSLSCTGDDKWTGDQPNCSAKPCGQLNETLHMKIVNGSFDTTYTYQDVIMLECDKGYTLRGSQTVQCIATGKWNESVRCEEVVSAKSQGPPVIAIGGGLGVAALIVALVTIVFVLIFKRRKKESTNAPAGRNRPHKDMNMDGRNIYLNMQPVETDLPNKTLTEETSLDDQDSYYEFSPKNELSKYAVKVTRFKDYVHENKGENGLLKSQFSKLANGLQFPTTVALSQQNRAKNKYKNICAYDQTRVVLKRQIGQSDYINACYINGYGSVHRYVASQGPIKDTEEDFWEMVYQLGSGKIVMLTNLIEDGKQKCEQYWPDEGSLHFGSIEIRHRSVDKFADFTIRNLSICKSGIKPRYVKQFHFTSWPDKGVPKYASSLVHFRNKVVNTPSTGKGPLVVHCSAGVGRTGTFIALDYLFTQANAVGEVDVFTCVETLRRQRVNMVQTSEQYVFLHFALEEALMCKTSATAAADFPEVYKNLQKRRPNERKKGLELEFEILEETSPVLPEKEFVSGKKDENKRKNRYSNILPVESHRVYLYTYAKGGNDYINAVVLPGYREIKAFIATQMPLQDTVIDFLRLLYENDVSSVVMLNEISDEKTMGRYWPEDSDTVAFGNFTVSISNEDHTDSVSTISIDLKYESEARVIKLFKVRFWPDGEQVPRSTSQLLTLMENVQIWQRKTGNNPVVVHCMNGCDKVGLYCVVETTIERLKIEQDVGIQQIIKQLRSRRPQIIPNVEQFEFCHEAVLEYMKQFETYSNFQ